MPATFKRGRRPVAAIGALLALSATVAACGGAGEGEDRPAASPRAERSATTIDMADIRFDPPRLTVERGQTVTFRNVGKLTHNAKGETFFSRVVEPGGSYRQTFDEAGTFDFVCTFHPGMEGTLTVR